jgi:hypothetical protein
MNPVVPHRSVAVDLADLRGRQSSDEGRFWRAPGLNLGVDLVDLQAPSIPPVETPGGAVPDLGGSAPAAVPSCGGAASGCVIEQSPTDQLRRCNS